MDMIRLLKVAPMEAPEIIEVEHRLETLQELVGGTIQAVYPWDNDPVVLLCDDEGKLKGYPANRMLTDEDGRPYDIVVGTFFICGLTADDFGSISDELVEKYTERFRYPEMLMRAADGGIVWLRIGSGEEPRVIG